MCYCVKITSNCGVMSCIACSVEDLKEICSKTRENVINKLQCVWRKICNLQLIKPGKSRFKYNNIFY